MPPFSSLGERHLKVAAPLGVNINGTFSSSHECTCTTSPFSAIALDPTRHPKHPLHSTPLHYLRCPKQLQWHRSSHHFYRQGQEPEDLLRRRVLKVTVMRSEAVMHTLYGVQQFRSSVLLPVLELPACKAVSLLYLHFFSSCPVNLTLR